ncbi:uncharacterized protein K460DRAFT_397607 [Cucurbitaria berberidis CBS 394.84]|uniref:DUF7924 domain-containing protein n=1 Tax=Cucurbitaria berberidis CBS 394.84 TaxID=1168544 RepID=A0A9P4G916_9PLEO|nr:uncharacterized protein K460DRAFT_397607 [Cucurbitaria berberidis CBS 394.84]KAF1841363.1 hypothetical protein K460DRAFT_397607 [Cucurbitaria berberidis CBS 394.84]
MKRAISSCDLEPALVEAAPPAKRRRPIPLTRKALSQVQVLQCESTESVHHWVSSSLNDDMSMDPNQPHPRLLAQTMRRAKARSRTPSPVKKLPHCATPEYRNVTMKLASLFIERHPELPAHVAASVERILGTGTTKEASGQTGDEDTARDAIMANLAVTYRAQCRSLAGDCSGEGEWRSALLSILMSPLSMRWSPVLKISASEKPWNKYLKPTVPQLSTLDSRPLGPIVVPPPLSAALGAMPTPTARPFQDDPSASSAVSTTTSDYSTYSTNSEIHLSTPKPDITVGLESEAIRNAADLSHDILLHLQTGLNNPFISDPHQVPLGLRFPFLIVEAKGLNTGSNLIHAQNQAAVAAASAFNILSDLDALIPIPEVDVESPTPTIIFSLITEGPTHELWVHYQTADKYDMSCLQSWRTTLPGHSEKLVECLGRVMEWGAGDFRNGIVDKVGALWKSMFVPEAGQPDEHLPSGNRS